MKQERKPFPTLLSKTDAMIYAAEYMERQVSELRLIHMMAEVFSKSRPDEKPLDGEAKKALDDIKLVSSGIVDVELQAEAMLAAAKEIRAMANETKLVEARAARSTLTSEYAR